MRSIIQARNRAARVAPLAVAAALLVLLGSLAAPASAQDWKGLGRLEGKVLDADGKPIPDAVVRLENPGRGGGTTVKTDKKGRWAVLGLASGSWNIDIEVPGYAPKKLGLSMESEQQRMAPIEVRLDKAAPQGPAPELVDALKRGDEAFKAGRYPEARAEYEKVLAMRPDFAATLHKQIAYTYSQENNSEKTIEHLDKVLQADPANTEIRALLAQEAIKGGMLDKASEILKGLDDATIKDPDVFFNIAVLFLNKQKTDEAIPFFTKAVTLDPTYVDGYMQRGLAYLQLQRYAEAKADFRKVLELDPQGPKGQMAQKALGGLEKTK
jgi:tetratricopeptide (TPR) repeat protein